MARIRAKSGLSGRANGRVGYVLPGIAENRCAKCGALNPCDLRAGEEQPKACSICGSELHYRTVGKYDLQQFRVTEDAVEVKTERGFQPVSADHERQIRSRTAGDRPVASGRGSGKTPEGEARSSAHVNHRKR